MPPKRSLSSTHQELAGQWHPTLNYDLTPQDVDASYPEDVWWVCDLGHPFRARLSFRVYDGSGCSVCANKLVRPGINDLATIDPELAGEWHPVRNGALTPDLVAPGYTAAVYWQPPCGHWFESPPAQRRGDRRCQVCVDKRVYPGQNDFATLHPDLVGDLAPGQDVNLAQVRATSRKRGVKWLAPCGHLYIATPLERHEDPLPPECQRCRGKRSPKRVDLPTVAHVPWLLALWDHEANGALKPSEVRAGDGRQFVAWRCSQGHQWKRQPRYQKPDCGYCANRALLPGVNDLATVNPALAAQWHPTKNGDLTPDQVMPKSDLEVWWLGPCGHDWQARIGNRSNGSGCRRRCPESRL